MSDSSNNAGLQQEDLFYEDRFLESWAGAIITNPSTAIVELVANCWDAYATEVRISWPDPKNNKQFSISDNGKGMTKAEFDYIWRAMSYVRELRRGVRPGVCALRLVFTGNQHLHRRFVGVQHILLEKNEVVRLVARFGGFLARKGDGEPGVKTIRLGMQRIVDFVAGIRYMREVEHQTCV